ncbi:beta-ketoacyl-[acyl-carrier-protein] synthase family protein [Tumebacillus permanentifrigoris]|uniref:3-oxoacyl-[acyl-carrier-protein] synthase II n=1 Tax=Tumebacillus permanentifrigoris TaxID=378543 RepID=A0A316D5P2_9BACL|nr:beta-ketoacyl synthase N-terminal-like domain-containing protein [Tumebacillus permanentifrigoris]PWK08990.1 3-oxoacyl-[acyl-carrier-protein] synthase II [Tumebacillus permanentifrigoris]
MSTRVVLTGLGVVSSIGTDKEAFLEGLLDGRSGIAKVTRFTTEDGEDVFAGEVVDTQFNGVLEKSALRRMDRFTILNIAGVQQVVEDAGLTREQLADIGETVGLILNTSFGSWHSTNVFTNQIIEDGPAFTSPLVFPNTVLNAAQGQVAIRFQTKGPTTTLTGIPGITYGLDLIRSGRVNQLIAGGVDELHANAAKAYAVANMAVIDEAGQGMRLGEGIGGMFMETLESAEQRGAHVYCEVLSYGIACDPNLSQNYSQADTTGESIAYAMRQALSEAGLQVQDIDAILVAANGCSAFDQAEANAIADVFGDAAANVAQLQLKTQIGETFGASHAIATVAGALFLDKQVWPGEEKALTHILVNGIEIGGNQVSVVLKRV